MLQTLGFRIHWGKNVNKAILAYQAHLKILMQEHKVHFTEHQKWTLRNMSYWTRILQTDWKLVLWSGRWKSNHDAHFIAIWKTITKKEKEESRYWWGWREVGMPVKNAKWCIFTTPGDPQKINPRVPLGPVTALVVIILVGGKKGLTLVFVWQCSRKCYLLQLKKGTSRWVGGQTGIAHKEILFV